MARALLCALLLPATATLGVAQLVPLDDTFTVNSSSGYNGFQSIAFAADGSFLVVWESSEADPSGFGIAGQLYGPDLATIGSEFVISSYTPGDQFDPDVAALAGGGWVVVWDSEVGPNYDVRAQLLQADGALTGSELVLAAGTGFSFNDAVVAGADDGGFVVVWEEEELGGSFEEDLRGQRYDAAGAAVGSQLEINSFNASGQEDVDISSAPGQGFAVVWESEGQDGNFDSIWARRLDATGTLVGDEIAVNSYTTGDQDNPHVAMSSAGSFVVVWEDDTQDPVADSIQARWFDATGAPTTDEFQVNSDTQNPSDPRVGVDAFDRAVMVWNTTAGPDGIDILARAASADGTLIGAELTVNTMAAPSQDLPHLAVRADGRLQVNWRQFPPAPGADVRARWIDLRLFGDGFESGDVQAWSSATP